MKASLTYSDINGQIYNPDGCAPLDKAVQAKELNMYVLARDHYPGIRLQNDELEGIKSVGYWNAIKPQKWYLDWHYNEGIEVCLLEAGKVNFCTVDKTYHLPTHALTITRPWLKHKIERIESSRLYWFILDVDVRFPHQEWIWPDWIVLSSKDLSRLTKILQQNEQPVWMANPTIQQSFTEIGMIIKNREDVYFDSKIKIVINRIFISLLEQIDHQGLVLDEELVSTKRSVELFLSKLDNLYPQILTLENMAEYCRLGVTQFSKYCRELTNRSPIKYLNDLRLEKACEQLLTKPEKSIIDITYDCGFSSNPYFTRVFKERFGISPQGYRKKHL